MNHNHHENPTLLALRRGNSTPASASTAAADTVPKPQHAFSFPNGITKIPPPILIADPSSSSHLSSYLSLKNFLPSPVVSSPPAVSSDISIRHRLVKQAAWAYLQPAAVSPVSPGPSLRRIWANFSSCFCRVVAFVSRLLRRLVMAGPVRFTR